MQNVVILVCDLIIFRGFFDSEVSVVHNHHQEQRNKIKGDAKDERYPCLLK